MTGSRVGWQDDPGGVEPGFADALMMRFGAGMHDADGTEQASYGVMDPDEPARDGAWLRHPPE